MKITPKLLPLKERKATVKEWLKEYHLPVKVMIFDTPLR
jgi:hypothetical protein